MAYAVFVSHSMAAEDLPIVEDFAAHLVAHGISCYLAERDPRFGQPLVQKIEAAIDAADCVIAFLTHGGAASQFVNQEIGMARAKKKLVIPILEKGVNMGGVNVGAEYLELDRYEPGSCALALGAYLLRLKAAKETNTAVAWGIIAALAALALKS